MRGRWQQIIDGVLRPSRPTLAACLVERESHLASRKLVNEARARAMRDCEQRIEELRAAIFAANDGMIPSGMTDLERAWRGLAKRDPDGGCMDLWARIAPAAWIDRKRFRDSENRVDAAIALAADVEGVEAAERAIERLRTEIEIGSSVRFTMREQDSAHLATLFDARLRAARPDVGIRERAEAFERQIQTAALERFPGRPLLARDLACLAGAECVLGANDPLVAALVALFGTGYVIASLDRAGVVLEVPSL